MSIYEAPIEHFEYRVALLKRDSPCIWIKGKSAGVRLPRVVAAAGMRQIEQIQTSVERSCGARAIILDVLSDRQYDSRCAVVEMMSPVNCLGLTAISIDELPDSEISSVEKGAVQAMVAGTAARCSSPLSRQGWIYEALEWLRAETGVAPASIRTIRQLNAGSGFMLLQFASEDGAGYWLKATGHPNAHEFNVTKLLAKLCRDYDPRYVAFREEWNAWLMEGAGRPAKVWTLPLLTKATRSMAELQLATMSGADALLTAGAFDHRLAPMQTSLADLVDYLDEAMAKQVTISVPQIERCRLREIAEILKRACARMEGLSIPDTVVPGDVSTGNILFRDGACVFTDWCEVGVGNPFPALQYLCLLQPSVGLKWKQSLQAVYISVWRKVLSESQVAHALALMPVLAILVRMYGRGSWLHTEERNSSQTARYARSLTRHLDRATRAPELLEVLCH